MIIIPETIEKGSELGSGNFAITFEGLYSYKESDKDEPIKVKVCIRDDEMWVWKKKFGTNAL